MSISVPVNHNYYEEDAIPESALDEAFAIKKAGEKKQLRELFTSVFELKLGAEEIEKFKIFNLKRRHFEDDKERLIIRLYSKERPEKEKEYFIQTGLYAGKLIYKGFEINITTKYGDTFLKRMLNFVNDIYVDNEEVNAKKDKTENQFSFIIAYLFIQSLEKAAILGLPQQYKKQKERGYKVRGSIDFNDFLKKDIPFQGKLTSKFRQRKYVQEIVDVLYLSLRKLERQFGKEIQSRLLGLKQFLKQNYSGQFAGYKTIQKAKAHQSINNPMFSRFKRVLEYAQIILLDKDLLFDNEEQRFETVGYFFDVSELYELYLEKLLSRNFPEWQVSGQEKLNLYQNQFYSRPMFPDLVMRHSLTGKTVVFDAKFKKMDLQNRDVDGADLHQIHSYSGYYRKNLIASGLIYPLSKEIDKKKTYSKSIYGNNENKINFIIDGICVSKNQTMQELISNEDKFIERVSHVINNTNIG